MIRVLVADDHAIVRGGLRRLFDLTSDIQVAGEAANGAEVIDLLRQGSMDLLMMDLNMPGISGADLITRIKAHHPQLPILVFSMHNEPQVATRMLKAGAGGYITKDCEPHNLLTAVRKVAAHANYIDPAIAEKMVFDVTSNSSRPPHSFLSSREMEVLRLLTTGMGVSDIALELAISGKTVSTHKARLMEKLHLHSLADLMRYAMAHELLG